MRKAEQIDHSNPLTHFNLGRLYRQMGKLPDAERELRSAVRMRPALARAYYQLATVYRSQGRTAGCGQGPGAIFASTRTRIRTTTRLMRTWRRNVLSAILPAMP